MSGVGIRDDNYTPVALGVSSTDSTVVLPIKINPATGRVITQYTGGTITSKIDIASSATPTFSVDTVNCVNITALAVNISSMTTGLSGTPVDFQRLLFRIKDNGTARTITWGASYVARGTNLPTTTVLGKIMYVLFIYNSTAGVWDCVANPQEV